MCLFKISPIPWELTFCVIHTAQEVLLDTWLADCNLMVSSLESGEHLVHAKSFFKNV